MSTELVDSVVKVKDTGVLVRNWSLFCNPGNLS